MRILIVTTSCYTLDSNHPTGLWLEEFAVPYTELTAQGALITVASPLGGAVPLDPKTEPDYMQRVEWAAALEALTDNAGNFDYKLKGLAFAYQAGEAHFIPVGSQEEAEKIALEFKPLFESEGLNLLCFKVSLSC